MLYMLVFFNFWLCFHRKRVLVTTNDIADYLDDLEDLTEEDDIDDEVMDRDYVVEALNPDTSEDDEELIAKVHFHLFYLLVFQI
jgi:hypothetical protein